MPKKPEVEDRQLDDALLSLLERFPAGLEQSKIAKLLPPPYRVAPARVKARVKALAERGRVEVWGKSALGLAKYADVARPAIRAALADRPLSITELKRRLEGAIAKEATQLKKLLEEEIRAGAIFEHAKPPGSKAAIKYALSPADATLYLAPIEKAITALLKKLKKSGLDREAIVEALHATSQRPAPAAVAAPSTTSSVDRAPPTARVDPRTFFDAVLSVRPDARAHVLVSIREVRRRLAWSKLDFDHLVLALARDGLITLHHHDHPAGLTPGERDDSVADERGTHYVGLVLEENA